MKDLHDLIDSYIRAANTPITIVGDGLDNVLTGDAANNGIDGGAGKVLYSLDKGRT